MNRLKNKVAVVTGAAGGMGESIAKLFASEGARVMASDVQAEKLSTWVQKAKADGLNIDFAVHDVSNEKDWKQVAEKTFAVFGKIDILVNNAGIFPGFADCEQTSKELWDKVIAVNLTGPFIGCHTCIPYMKKMEAAIL